ncbi:hypothetical protein BX616_008257, partial [Lobosporangium transversale]
AIKTRKGIKEHISKNCELIPLKIINNAPDQTSLHDHPNATAKEGVINGPDPASLHDYPNVSANGGIEEQSQAQLERIVLNQQEIKSLTTPSTNPLSSASLSSPATSSSHWENSSTATTDQKKRSFRELALEASEQSHGSQTEKKKALLFVELLEAVPIVVKNNQGDEEVLLAHVKKLERLSSNGPFSITTERALPDNITADVQCSKCQPSQAPDLKE